MRVRSIIRDMEAGDPIAWERAELKLSQSDVRPENKAELRRAMQDLPDPRKQDA
jgi:hypothetical protein